MAGKQALLPLWGSTPNARAHYLGTVEHFRELCEQFVDADAARDEARMQELVSQMRGIVSRVDAFQRAQFRKWAKEREAQRS